MMSNYFVFSSRLLDSPARAEYDYVATFVYHDTGISCVGSFISNSLLTGKHF